MTSNTFEAAERAARAGDVDGLARMIDATPVLVAATSEDGDTLLGRTCRAATGDVAIPPDPGTPDQHAAVDLLLARGSDPDTATNDGWAPLHTAAMAGHADLARRLLAAGAARGGRLHGRSGGSPLALALFYAQTEVADVLASPPVPDNLRHAAALGADLAPYLDGTEPTDAARAGLDWYGPPEWFPEWERRLDQAEVLNEALTWSSRNGRIASMERLVELGADVNANPYRGTALLWAVYANQLEAATWLLDHGADPNLRHDFGGAGHGVGACAIHLAAQFDAIDAVRLLLDRGADPGIVDGAHGGDAHDWAHYSGAEETAAYLAANR